MRFKTKNLLVRIFSQPHFILAVLLVLTGSFFIYNKVEASTLYTQPVSSDALILEIEIKQKPFKPFTSAYLPPIKRFANRTNKIRPKTAAVITRIAGKELERTEPIEAVKVLTISVVDAMSIQFLLLINKNTSPTTPSIIPNDIT